MLIAAHALYLGTTLVTNNVKEFFQGQAPSNRKLGIRIPPPDVTLDKKDCVTLDFLFWGL